MTKDDLSHSLVALCVGSYKGSRRLKDLGELKLTRVNLGKIAGPD